MINKYKILKESIELIKQYLYNYNMKMDKHNVNILIKFLKEYNDVNN